jgi:hypothetical protein
MQLTLMKGKIYRARVTQADLPISLNGAAARPAMARDKLQEATSHRGAESAAAAAGDEDAFPRRQAFFTPIFPSLQGGRDEASIASAEAVLDCFAPPAMTGPAQILKPDCRAASIPHEVQNREAATGQVRP